MSEELAFRGLIARSASQRTRQNRGINELLGFLNKILEEHVGL